VTSASPKLTWLFLPAAALILISGAWRSIGWRQEARRNLAFIAVLLLALYMLISTAWAVDREDALVKAALLCGIAVLVLGARASVAAWDREWLRRAGIAFGAGALLGALFVFSEFLTEGAVLRWWKAFTHQSGSATGPAELVAFSKGMLRTHVQMIVIYFWPALLALSLVPGKPRRLGLIALYMVVAIVPVFISERESSQLALIASIVFFALAWLWREAAPRALAIVWCLGFVLALPIALAAYDAGGQGVQWLPFSARARVVIWGHTAERVLEAPWLGIGAGSTEAVKKRMSSAPPPPSAGHPQHGEVYPSGTGPHAHDVFLQVWYELGAIGVLLVAFFGAALALRIPLLPVRAQPFACAAFAAFATSIAFAWSVWQVWLLCAAGLLLLYLFVGARAPEGPKVR
jgi:O-antigen ligase